MRLQHELILLSVSYSDIMIQKVQGQCAVSIWMHIGKHKKKKTFGVPAWYVLNLANK